MRFRITPSELAALEHGASLLEVLHLPGGSGWRATILPGAGTTSLTSTEGELCISLAQADRQRLSEPHREGVYFQSEGDTPVRYFIEKDFPCAHPRPAEAMEPLTETFAAPAGFGTRKNTTLKSDT